MIALTKKELETIKEQAKAEVLKELKEKRRQRWFVVLYMFLVLLTILAMPLGSLLHK